VSDDLRRFRCRRRVAAALGADDAVDDGHADAGQIAELHAVEDVLAGGCALSMMIKSADRPTSMMPKSSARIRALRLTSLASLALTAPREERSREICRIAVPFRRAGLFLRRIRIWLHQLPIKMPGGMTEHRQNDSEADEER
jgi:hypothetical protein